MKICILAEGSYPYIAGGVSSWIHLLVNELEEVQFIILSIMPSYQEKLEYKYSIPDNVVKIKTIYLDSYKQFEAACLTTEPQINEALLQEIRKFIRFEEGVDWEVISQTIANPSKIGTVVDFLQSKTFWQLLLELYQEEFSTEGFNHFFWTLKSMFLSVINIMQVELPEADIYHAVSTGYAGLLGLLAKTKYSYPFLLTEHGIYAREREEDILKTTWVKGRYKSLWIDFFYFISRGAYQSADQVISLSTKNQEIQVELGAIEEKTRVVPNGVDLERFNLKKEEHSGFNIGAIVRIVPIKDVKTLIKAFEIVNKNLLDVTLYLMGPADEAEEYYKECLNLINRLGLADNIIITGRVEVLEYIKKMDVLVLTSISEGQPLVMLEGFAASIPFVTTDVGSCRELIEGSAADKIGPAGLVTNPVTPAETAQAIIRLLEDKKLREKMSRNARKRAEKYYSKAKLISTYQQMYMGLAKE